MRGGGVMDGIYEFTSSENLIRYARAPLNSEDETWNDSFVKELADRLEVAIGCEPGELEPSDPRQERDAEKGA